MEIFDCAQGSEEWRAARCGVPTASNFADILAKGEGKMRRAYLLRLAGEVLTGCPAETYSNGDMARGQAMEEEARRYYAFHTDAEPELVGFIRNGRKGCSPDALIGPSGMLEIKTAQPNVLIDALLKDEFLPAHRAQCQGALWVAEREWIDLCVYWPSMPTLIKRAVRDEAYIATLASEVDRFTADLDEVVDRIRRYGQPTRVAA